jgi:hypothetical protein
VTRRKERKALTRWEADTREWGNRTGRLLVRAVCGGPPLPTTPFGVGVVLGPHEQLWVEYRARFLQEVPLNPQSVHSTGWPPVRRWLVTAERIVGRLGDDRLYEYRWEHIVCCRVHLTLGQERVSLDLPDGSPLTWAGPGVAPMAVAAVYKLHGRRALFDHPGLAALRAHERPRQSYNARSPNCRQGVYHLPTGGCRSGASSRDVGFRDPRRRLPRTLETRQNEFDPTPR